MYFVFLFLPDPPRVSAFQLCVLPYCSGSRAPATTPAWYLQSAYPPSTKLITGQFLFTTLAFLQPTLPCQIHSGQNSVPWLQSPSPSPAIHYHSSPAINHLHLVTFVLHLGPPEFKSYLVNSVSAQVVQSTLFLPIGTFFFYTKVMTCR